MWFGFLHAIIINSYIGYFESNYLKQHSIPNRMWVIILGNYFSMIIGLYFIAPYFSSIGGNLDFWGGKTSLGNYKLNGFLIGMLASFFATLILELPFLLLSLKEKYNRKKGMIFFLQANLISNLVMFIIYFLLVYRGST